MKRNLSSVLLAMSGLWLIDACKMEILLAGREAAEVTSGGDGGNSVTTLPTCAGDPHGAVGNSLITLDDLSELGAQNCSLNIIFGSPTAAPQALAMDNAGNFIISGQFSDSLDLGGDPLISPTGSWFLAKLDANYQHVWSKQLDGELWVADIASDSDGNVIVSARVRGILDFGAGPLYPMSTESTSTPFNESVGDVALVKFDPNGNVLWSKRFGGDDDQIGTQIDIDIAGNVTIWGTYKGDLKNLGSLSGHGGFVAKLAASTGAPLWAHGLDLVAGIMVAVDPVGNTFAAGSFHGTINFGTGIHQSGPHGSNVFLVKLDQSGNLLWSRSFGGPFDDTCLAINVDKSSNPILAVSVSSSIDFGCGLTPQSWNSVDSSAVAKFDSDGHNIWSQYIQYVGLVAAGSTLAVGKDGTIVLERRGRFDLFDGSGSWLGYQLIRSSPQYYLFPSAPWFYYDASIFVSDRWFGDINEDCRDMQNVEHWDQIFIAKLTH